MKQKRLDRDSWGFQGFPYYQVRVDTEEFHGLVGLIYILSGKKQYWDLEKSKKTPVSGKGMFWLQLIPDGKNCVMTVKYTRKKKKVQGVKYPHSISVIYCDIINRLFYAEEDLVAIFEDMYLDVVLSPKGDASFIGEEELFKAYQNGELTQEQYDRAMDAGQDLLYTYGRNFENTEVWCDIILETTIELIEKYPECKIH